MEHWKKIHISTDYAFNVEVSSLGRVRRSEMTYTRTTSRGTIVASTKPATIMQGEKLNNGYYSVNFYINKKRKRHLVHRLVGMAFVTGYEPQLTINHINGDKLDNRPKNLEWVTLADNTSKQWQTGLVDLRGDANPSKKISAADVLTIRARTADGSRCHAELARQYGVSDSLIGHIHHRRRWKHI